MTETQQRLHDDLIALISTTGEMVHMDPRLPPKEMAAYAVRHAAFNPSCALCIKAVNKIADAILAQEHSAAGAQTGGEGMSHSREANIIAPGICLDGVGGTPGEETGERPILVAENTHCDECDSEHDFEACPKCASWIAIGYGLMFGGMGVYKFCNNDACDWFWKQEDDDE